MLKAAVLGALLRRLRRYADAHCAPPLCMGGSDDPLMIRWHLVPPNDRFCVYLHQWKRSDIDRALHDHRAANLSLVLSGGYFEHLRGGKRRWRGPGSLTFRRAATPHRVQLPVSDAGGTWSLFIKFRNVREWGFWCPTQGWRPWTEVLSSYDARDLEGCE